MTKLDHTRPILRYIDNFRREWKLDSQRADTLSFGVGSKIQPAANRKIFPLNPKESDAAHGLFDSIYNYLTVEDKIVAGLFSNASKQAKKIARQQSRTDAEERVKSAATVFCAALVLSGIEGRKNLQHLYQEIENGLSDSSSYFLWDFINNVAMKAGIEQVSKVVEKHLPS